MRLRGRIWAWLGSIAGLFALPTAYLALDRIGPASRIVFRPYLFDDSFGKVLVACVLGAALGSEARRFAEPERVRPAPRIKLALLLLWIGWCLVPHFMAFPAGASMAERDAWARSNVKEYAGLVHAVARIPEITRDVGRIREVAPTSADQHVFAREMNGDDLRFALDVAGEKGSGVLRVECTIMGDAVLDWRSGTWTFDGKETVVSAPAKPLPRR